MRGTDQEFRLRLYKRLAEFERDCHVLPGIATDEARRAFVEQVVESLRRQRYLELLGNIKLSPLRAAPESTLFDPLKAAVTKKRLNQFDEACWLIFLSVHCGRHRRDGWTLARQIYGGAGPAERWEWARISCDVSGFRIWFGSACARWKADGVRGRFGNHRKRESYSATSTTGTGAVIESYVNWILRFGTHKDLFAHFLQEAKEPRRAFHALYESMVAVTRFGRTGRFDYLSTLGRLGLLAIEPGSIYLDGASGPLDGSRLLFSGNRESSTRVKELEPLATNLEHYLDTGMEALEDALCNWQKNPTRFVAFRG